MITPPDTKGTTDALESERSTSGAMNAMRT